MSSVASHLGIELAEYDHRIRTFIPAYEEMLDAAANAVDVKARTIVELGVGTGALAARCLKRAPKASVIGIDADSGILALAGRRLGRRATLQTSNFVRASLPRADAVVASIALHHVRTRRAKLQLYRRIRAALNPAGVFISADCHPAGAPRPRASAARRLDGPFARIVQHPQSRSAAAGMAQGGRLRLARRGARAAAKRRLHG